MTINNPYEDEVDEGAEESFRYLDEYRGHLAIDKALNLYENPQLQVIGKLQDGWLKQLYELLDPASWESKYEPNPPVSILIRIWDHLVKTINESEINHYSFFTRLPHTPKEILFRMLIKTNEMIPEIKVGRYSQTIGKVDTWLLKRVQAIRTEILTHPTIVEWRAAIAELDSNLPTDWLLELLDDESPETLLTTRMLIRLENENYLPTSNPTSPTVVVDKKLANLRQSLLGLDL